jgi:rhodanese-related sulfurtransferase
MKAMGKLTDLLKLAQERAKNLSLPYAGALTPKEAYDVWQLAPGAKLVDVRTRAEWDWVGRVPNAVEIEWMSYPGNQPNAHFMAQFKREIDPESLVMFMCRSGVRSDKAARAATGEGYSNCYNVLEGFEGDKDANAHRNRLGGWRHAGLPWQQG